MPTRSTPAALGAAIAIAIALGPGAADGLAAPLPDGRAFEHVSPSGGNGTPLIQTGSALGILDDDTVVATSGVAPLQDAPSGVQPTTVMRRTGTGWATSQLMPADPDPNSAYVLQDATPDLRTALFLQVPSEIFSVPTERAAPGSFLLRDAGGTSHLLFEGSNEAASDPFVGGLSADGSTAYFAAGTDPGTKEPIRRTAFSWTATSGTQPIAREAGDPLETCSIEVQGGFYAGTPTGLTTNAVSADGRSTFVQAFNAGGGDGGAACPALQQTFLVRDGRTVGRISAPTEPGVATSTLASTFVAATPDARTAYFRTNAKMVTEDADTTSDVYRWRAADGATPAAVTCVTCGAAGAVTSVAASPQADVLYVRAGTQLLAVSGGAATPIDSGVSSIGGVSRDGAHVVYTKGATIYTGGPGTAPTCVSCRADGTPAAGQIQTSVLNRIGPTSGGTVGASSIAGDLLGAISDDGDTIAFVSGENIDGAATDGPTHAFRWKRGEGVALVADDASNFGTALSPSGNTVFFAAYGPVAPGDADQSQALYGARVGGGFPIAVPAAPCAGDACRPSGPAGPAPAAPGSTAPAGIGNASPPKETAAVPSPAVSLRSLTSRQRAAAGRSGVLRLRVTTAGGGTARARATARIGSRTRTVATASARTSTPRSTRTLTLRLTKQARTTLRRSGRLRVRVVLSLPKAKTRTTTVTLTRKRG